MLTIGLGARGQPWLGAGGDLVGGGGAAHPQCGDVPHLPHVAGEVYRADGHVHQLGGNANKLVNIYFFCNV